VSTAIDCKLNYSITTGAVLSGRSIFGEGVRRFTGETSSVGGGSSAGGGGNSRSAKLGGAALDGLPVTIGGPGRNVLSSVAA